MRRGDDGDLCENIPSTKFSSLLRRPIWMSHRDPPSKACANSIYTGQMQRIHLLLSTHTYSYTTYTLWIIQNVRVVARAKSHQLTHRALSSDLYSPIPLYIYWFYCGTLSVRVYGDSSWSDFVKPDPPKLLRTLNLHNARREKRDRVEESERERASHRQRINYMKSWDI